MSMSRIARIVVFGALTMALQGLAIHLIKSAAAPFDWQEIAGLLVAGLAWECAGVSFRAVFPAFQNRATP